MAELPRVSIEQLEQMFGRSQRRIYQLVKSGHLPQPSPKGYDLAACVRGMVKYLDELNAKKDGTLEQTRIRNLELRNNVLVLQEQEEEINLGKLKGEFHSVNEVAESLRAIGEQVKSQLFFELKDQLPIVCAGLDAERIREENNAAAHRILGRWRDWAAKYEAAE